MLRRLMKDLFGPTLVHDDGKPVRSVWVGDDEYFVLINPTTNRIYATLWKDSDGKIYPTVFVSPFELRRVFKFEKVINVGLQTFPYCAADLFRFENWRISAAQDYLVKFLEYAGLF
jgi:hypothetical protein